MATVKDWSDLTMEHLMYAYRKAKADVFFDRIPGATLKFAEYEATLPEKLKRLLDRLKDKGNKGELDTILRESSGSVRLVAKKLSVTPRPPDGFDDFHQFFSSSTASFPDLEARNHLSAQFRIISDFEVEFHLISALWINLIGHKYDALLGEEAHGTRLKRHPTDDCHSPNSLGEYHLQSVGSFGMYFGPYRRWQRGAMDALKRELELDRDVIALSLDIANFYHSVDPEFLLDNTFKQEAGLELNDFEERFTASLVAAMKEWSAKAAGTYPTGDLVVSGTALGLPMGLAASRVIANVLLLGVDKSFKRGMAPLYYGRYVDDILLVISDPGDLKDARGLFQYLVSRIDVLAPVEQADGPSSVLYEFDLPYRKASSLMLKASKQKVFFLSGQSGLDLLATVQAAVRSVSSERRLLPMPDRLETTAAANVLSAADSTSDDAISLGRANGLTIRRLGWSIQLRAVETLADALPQDEWRDQRNRYYDFTCDHVLRPERLLDYLDHLPRLIAMAVSQHDWEPLHRMYCHAKQSIGVLKTSSDQGNTQVEVNGAGISGETQVWSDFDVSLDELVSETILRSLAPRDFDDLPRKIKKLVNLPDFMAPKSQKACIQLLVEADLSITPYKTHIRVSEQEKAPTPGEEDIYRDHPFLTDLQEYLLLSRNPQVGNARRLNSGINSRR